MEVGWCSLRNAAHEPWDYTKESEPVDLDLVFGRRAPKVLEIGSGMGETTARIAQDHADIDYVAVEVHTPGVGSLLKLIEGRGLHNLRVVQHDAVEVVKDMIAPGSLSAIHVFFPDPWPKKRHHKRHHKATGHSRRNDG